MTRTDITGLLLAGGRGTRMGGVDKGLQLHQGDPLALHALRRLSPQVGSVAINANRNLLEYEFLGAPVWPDTLPGQPGPLAGVLTGLTRCTTPWLLTVACDTPNFPTDLAERLCHALEAGSADIAMAATPGDGGPRHQPVFCLIHTKLRDSLAAFLQSGERQAARWALQEGCAMAVFDDEAAFFNVNTPADLAQLNAPR